ncbi:hypothetical protein L1987_75315 [Smallanthus sonchifolius]|uniref:Uncharacterized protein n=1 Tax=Smallanthus sonchifolius TaxID=185202 RepID=A0ACB9A5L9_9ASTR|nr:hypothetical protein L1987_75315 [Smallanthus sonchifolius]
MMAWFSFLVATLIIISLSAKLTFSSSLRFSNHNFPTEAGDLLLGDAHLVGDGDSVHLSRPNLSSSGIILRSTPFEFTSSVSLSSNFTFEIGNGVALVIIPANFPSKFAKNTSFAFLDENRFLSIEFDANVCQISSSRVSNVTKINHVLNDGVKLTSWIDYRASLKRLDVRLSKLGDPKPVEPLISYRIDLGEILKGKEVLLGLASCNGKHEQVTSVYSWSSEIKDVPKVMHSIPAIPFEHSTVHDSKNKGCFVSGFIFAAGCGALAALVLLFVLPYVVDRRKVQGEGSVCPVDFGYAKIGVVKVNDLETAMK